MGNQDKEDSVTEDPDRIQADLDHLRHWLSKQPHIHGRTDDKFLLRYLRGCKYSLERAKEKIDTFYTFRTALPEFFTGRDTLDPVMQECFRLGVITLLDTDTEGRLVVLCRGGPIDPLKIPVTLGTKSGFMLAEAMMEELGTEIGKGIVLIFDMKGMSLSQVAHFTPAIAKKNLMVYECAYPLRPKAVHFLNMPSVLDSVLTFATSFLKEKLRRRIIIHKDIESMYEAIPKDILPEEYGGGAGPLQDIIEKWRQKMTTRRDFFLNDEQYRVDESKRAGQPKTHSDLFGFEGSFRRLSVD